MIYEESPALWAFAKLSLNPFRSTRYYEYSPEIEYIRSASAAHREDPEAFENIVRLARASGIKRPFRALLVHYEEILGEPLDGRFADIATIRDVEYVLSERKRLLKPRRTVRGFLEARLERLTPRYLASYRRRLRDLFRFALSLGVLPAIEDKYLLYILYREPFDEYSGLLEELKRVRDPGILEELVKAGYRVKRDIIRSHLGSRFFELPEDVILGVIRGLSKREAGLNALPILERLAARDVSLAEEAAEILLSKASLYHLTKIAAAALFGRRIRNERAIELVGGSILDVIAGRSSGVSKAVRDLLGEPAVLFDLSGSTRYFAEQKLYAYALFRGLPMYGFYGDDALRLFEIRDASRTIIGEGSTPLFEAIDAMASLGYRELVILTDEVENASRGLSERRVKSIENALILNYTSYPIESLVGKIIKGSIATPEAVRASLAISKLVREYRSLKDRRFAETLKRILIIIERFFEKLASRAGN